MLRSPIIRIIYGVILALIVLGTLRYKPWNYNDREHKGSSRPRDQLNVGFLPVT